MSKAQPSPISPTAPPLELSHSAHPFDHSVLSLWPLMQAQGEHANSPHDCSCLAGSGAGLGRVLVVRSQTSTHFTVMDGVSTVFLGTYEWLQKWRWMSTALRMPRSDALPQFCLWAAVGQFIFSTSWFFICTLWHALCTLWRSYIDRCVPFPNQVQSCSN